MKRFFLFMVLGVLLFSSSVFASPCEDDIDNDGDGLTDTDDRSCLDSTDASEQALGYQIALSSSLDSTCLSTLESSGYGTSCLEEHYQELSWYIAYSTPSSFSSCLD